MSGEVLVCGEPARSGAGEEPRRFLGETQARLHGPLGDGLL